MYYVSPAMRAPNYLLGILLGYLLYITHDKPVKIAKVPESNYNSSINQLAFVKFQLKTFMIGSNTLVNFKVVEAEIQY